MSYFTLLRNEHHSILSILFEIYFCLNGITFQTIYFLLCSAAAADGVCAHARVCAHVHAHAVVCLCALAGVCIMHHSVAVLGEYFLGGLFSN